MRRGRTKGWNGGEGRRRLGLQSPLRQEEWGRRSTREGRKERGVSTLSGEKIREWSTRGSRECRDQQNAHVRGYGRDVSFIAVLLGVGRCGCASDMLLDVGTVLPRSEPLKILGADFRRGNYLRESNRPAHATGGMAQKQLIRKQGRRTYNLQMGGVLHAAGASLVRTNRFTGWRRQGRRCLAGEARRWRLCGNWTWTRPRVGLPLSSVRQADISSVRRASRVGGCFTLADGRRLGHIRIKRGTIASHPTC